MAQVQRSSATRSVVVASRAADQTSERWHGFSTNGRSLERLEVSVRCGCRPNACQIRRRVEMPEAAKPGAMVGPIERLNQLYKTFVDTIRL